MPPAFSRPTPNPQPKTDSARAAARAFYCELCSKGYARMNEYEAHLSSYDHSHKQRLKEMRVLSKDPLAGEKARKEEARREREAGLVSISLGGDVGSEGGEGGVKKGFKKMGFKSAFVPVGGAKTAAKTEGEVGRKVPARVVGFEDVVGESETEDEGYEVYDPRRPAAP